MKSGLKFSYRCLWVLISQTLIEVTICIQESGPKYRNKYKKNSYYVFFSYLEVQRPWDMINTVPQWYISTIPKNLLYRHTSKSKRQRCFHLRWNSVFGPRKCYILLYMLRRLNEEQSYSKMTFEEHLAASVRGACDSCSQDHESKAHVRCRDFLHNDLWFFSAFNLPTWK